MRAVSKSRSTKVCKRWVGSERERKADMREREREREREMGWERLESTRRTAMELKIFETLKGQG